ncbi:helix-turn-helix domain-containing protein [Streptomyces lydicus]|uniref:helix-turn-helix domain-containing protein n=1 Tax=Streptomyces lydicus TaxID=47763 RepID=UPI0037BD2665
MGELVAGRGLKPLPDDGHPRTQFAQDLRMLREQAGAPSYRILVEKVGYTLATYSSMFNGKALPEREQLLDLVGYLGGDTEEWAKRLRGATSAEEQLKIDTNKRKDVYAEIDALRAELEGYQLIASDPESVFARAAQVQADAQKRIAAAVEIEVNLRTAAARIETQLGETSKAFPLAQARAREIIDQARSAAQEIEYQAHAKATDHLNGAKDTAKSLLEEAQVEASNLIERAGMESRRLRANAGRIVDQLVQEGDRYLEEAREDRLQAELERQRGAAQAERMKLRAKVDLYRVIVEAQQKLLDVGGTESAALLDILLQDLGINDAAINSSDLHGRHRRASPRTTEEEANLLFAGSLGDFKDSEDAIKVSARKIPLPRRAKPQDK